MVPYDQLLPIEQAIVDWKIAHPVADNLLTIAMLIIVVSFAVWNYRHERKIQQERMKRERAEKRAWIKSQGGL